MSDRVKEVLKQIKEDATRQEEDGAVEEICIDSINFEKFTPEISKALEKYKETLLDLSFNECGITSLQNLPNVPQLQSLELTDNKIKGSELKHLKKLSNLESLSLGGNEISEFKDLEVLKDLPNLIQLELFECPISEKADYIKKVFEVLPQLQVLDGKDKDGNEIAQEGAFDEDEEEEDYEGDEDHPDFTLRSDDLGAEEEGGLDEQDELSGDEDDDAVEYDDYDAYEEIKKKRKTQ